MVTKAQASRLDLGQGGIDAPGAVFDQRRTRTAWFEGQHVTADHFNRDQSYHITRQADLGRTIGQGVVEGLVVSLLPESHKLRVDPGMALAPSGEVLVLTAAAEIDLADAGSLRGFAGLSGDGAVVPPPETRTGLFILAASAVEYTSNPVGSYPVSINAARTLEDSVINEALVFTLTPFPVKSTGSDTDQWRAAAAYRIFVEDAEPELPPSAVPLAMVALIGRRVQWVDVAMVRRHCAPAAGDIFGLGMVDQTRRIAHFEQFDNLIAAEIAANPAAAAPASDLVRSLPPMGRMPVGAVALRAGPGEPERLSQNWFPSVMPVELVALPADEIEALLRESIHLPPIDLGAPDKVLANTPVTVIVPVARADWATTPAEVAETTFTLVPPPAVGGTTTDPAAMLRALMSGEPAPSQGELMLTGAWRTLLGRASHLWYARRRQFQRSDMLIAGTEDALPDTGPSIPPAPAPLPIVSDTAAAEMVEELVPLVKAAFASHGLDAQFAKQLQLEAPMPLRLLQRQVQFLAEGAPALALALGIAVVDRGEKPEDMLKTHVADTAAVYARAEPVLIGQGLGLVVPFAPDTNPEPAMKLISVTIGFDPRQLDGLVRQLSSLTIHPEGIEKADNLARALETALELAVPVGFALANPLGPDVLKQRLRLAATGALPAVAAGLSRVKPENRPKLLAMLRNAVETAPDDAALTKALLTAVRRIN
ncbi:MAG: hypothetical protein WCC66_13100 [Rhizobiaceae bacterium]